MSGLKILVILSGFLLPLSAVSATKIDSRAKALKEHDLPTRFKDRASPATVELRAQRLPDVKKEALFSLGFSVQPFAPRGMWKVRTVSTYAREDFGTTSLPQLDLSYSFYNFSENLWLGVSGGAGVTIQNQKIKTPSGFDLGEVTLMTSIAQVGPTLTGTQWKSLYWTVSPKIAQLNYTQQSENSLAQGSQSIPLYGLQLQVSYEVFAPLAFYAKWAQFIDSANQPREELSGLALGMETWW